MNAQEFKSARKRLGLTQAQAADALGYGDNARISNIETGRKQPSKSVILLLRAYLLHPRLINKLKDGGADNAKT